MNGVREYWYEINPSLLTLEKIAMNKLFPQFTLDKLDDGRMCWSGNILINNSTQENALLVVYAQNHPFCFKEYSSIRVYPVSPDAEEMLQKVGNPDKIKLFLKDDMENLYMRFDIENYNEFNSRTVFTAASALNRATEWLNHFYE